MANKRKLIYTEEELPQKSEIWKDFRLDKIGSSEIAIINGNFPSYWCDDHELFLRKMGKPFELNNKYVTVGNDHEDIARKYVENYLNTCINLNEDGIFCKNVYDRTSGITAKEAKFKTFTAQYKPFTSLFSSFDGVDIDNKLVLEIKCPSENTFKKILKNKIPTVPAMYLPQIQSQLMVANSHWGITQGIFAVFYKQGIYLENKKTKITNLVRLILIETQIDKNYCKELLRTCKKFHKLIELKSWKEDWNK